MNIQLALQLYKNMGFRYTRYRIWHELEKRTGLLQKKHPVCPETKSFISLDTWRQQSPLFIFECRKTIQDKKIRDEKLKENAFNILNGSILFFSNEWIYLGLDYNWLKNPDSGYEYNIQDHWTKIQDFNAAIGDIKYVWEKSRFTYLLTIMRYDYHFDEDHSAFVFLEIESWIDQNPINQGPNWKCSQEISLRLLNWLYVLNFYKDTTNLTEKLWQKIQNAVYWQLHHINEHIHFSRIAVRNNHAITETMILALSNMLFPYIPETKKWSQRGITYFEQEIDYQIYEDGAFIQHSMNYHRVLIQLLSFGFQISNIHKKYFSKKVYEKAYSCLNFLYQFVEKSNGHLPNYGSNDGALFFPLSNHEFRDYRPQLNTLHIILTGQDLFENQQEDFITKSKCLYSFDVLVQKYGVTLFKPSGYYLIREANSFTFFKCGSYKDRPFQADNLHLDIWKNGINVFRDAGSYKYNTDPKWVQFFMGTQSHNTVMLEGANQMYKGSRFIWFYWTKALDFTFNETEDSYIFEGKISVFTYINPKITHVRKVTKYKGQFKWLVEDRLENCTGKMAQQCWNIAPNSLVEIIANDTQNTVNAKSFESYYSSLYGHKEQQIGCYFEFKNEIKTQITIN
ncbi:heparinase II/III domain-containing protein [Flavobacterium branchiophilum]|uniref:Heparinase n=1 Tax=Flavobacterium branchiophilum TaxID=55197 RepID=A0A2H3KQV2_9FLAO|nr:heparinase II/III family protein [Flavobacterium branchiophilum]PDS26888.1 heparinase [Flavobacterium branchiophilum]